MADADDRPLLIVNADDYGLTAGVSRAICRGATDGIITSTSLLAVGPAIEQAVPWLDDVPQLGLGGHLAVVGEDPPVLSAREVPTLVDAKGNFAMSWRQFLPRCARRAVDPDDLRREFSAQLDRLEDLLGDRRLDHLDTHQNVHLWPMVRDIVLDLGDARGVQAVRVTRSSARSIVGLTVSTLGARLASKARRRGWGVPDATVGLDEAGSMTAPVLDASLRTLAAAAADGARSAELAAHPGSPDDPDLDRYAWGYHWAEELEALCAPAARAGVEQAGYRLGPFADLAQVHP